MKASPEEETALQQRQQWGGEAYCGTAGPQRRATGTDHGGSAAAAAWREGAHTRGQPSDAHVPAPAAPWRY